MKITRYINGEKFDFELSPNELRDAYFEQEHNYDLEDIEAAIPATDSDPNTRVEIIEEHGTVPCTISEAEDVVLEVTRKLLQQNAGDEATENILLAFAADILDISIDKLLEILEL